MLDTGNYDDWMPVIVYHTCFNKLDLRVTLLREKSDEDIKIILSNYLFGDFSGNMGLA